MTDQYHSGELLFVALLTFLEKREGEVIRGGLTVRLHPRALEYLASRLQLLQDLERLKQSSPQQFLRGAFADVDDYTRLHKLQQMLAATKRLCVAPTLHHLRDPTRVNLLAFSSLAYLELKFCDLSTSGWLGLANVSATLETLVCVGCIEELCHLLQPFSSAYALSGRGESSRQEEGSVAHWPCLTQLICKQNSLVEMDSSLRISSLRKLDLSSNNITFIQNLQGCTNLTELNLSHNNIDSLERFLEGPTSLVRLILQGNALKGFHGVKTLTNLTELDLRCNLLASYHDFRELQELHKLRLLWLEGNPLAYAPFYRLDVLSWVPAMLLELDGVATQKEELEAAGLRVAGQIPLAWQIMSDFVGQRELLWRPPKRTPPKPSTVWRAGSMRPSPIHGLSPARNRSASLRRPAPARRIVEFSGDPLAALEEILERPASPSPFKPLREDLAETLSQSSSASNLAARNPAGLSRASVHTIYREREDVDAVPAVQWLPSSKALLPLVSQKGSADPLKASDQSNSVLQQIDEQSLHSEVSSGLSDSDEGSFILGEEDLDEILRASTKEETQS